MKRNKEIDFMRAICTLSVILAHVSAPKQLNEIRTFDVVSLVFISGMSLRYSHISNYTSYLLKRIKKILVPAWLTTLIIILQLYVGGKFMGKFDILTPQYIAHSFLFIDSNSIGFIWIVKVYLIIAIFAPLIVKVENRISNNVALLTGGYLIIISMSILLIPLKSNLFFREYIIYAIQYSIIALFGLRLCKHNNAWKYIITFATIFFCVGLIFTKNFDTSSYKFPPQWYWISYGLFATIILHLVTQLVISKIRNINIVGNFVSWLSANSYTIYIFHIYLIWAFFLLEKMGYQIHWAIKYLIVVTVACLFTFLWNNLMNAFLKKHKFS